MNFLQRVAAVFAFEWQRALTLPRLAWMITLMLFPPLLLALVRSTANSDPPREVAAAFIYVLSPSVACMLSVFLWATPALSSELESRSWVYLAVRPLGPLAVLLGKYLVAVSWSLPVGIVSATLGVLAIGGQDKLLLIMTETSLASLSCIAYAALFLLIGVIIPKRAMVAGILYTVVFEVLLALIPAAVNLLTIQYRLRCLLVRWIDFPLRSRERSPVIQAYFGDETAAWHLGILLLMTLLYLLMAALVLRTREFTGAAETDV